MRLRLFSALNVCAQHGWSDDMERCSYITPNISMVTTSNSTSSIKSTLTTNLLLHYLVTLIFASLFSHTNQYVLGCSRTSNPRLLTRYATMILSYELESTRESILVFLTYILTWKSFFIFFSS